MRGRGRVEGGWIEGNQVIPETYLPQIDNARGGRGRKLFRECGR